MSRDLVTVPKQMFGLNGFGFTFSPAEYQGMLSSEVPGDVT